MEEKSEEMVKLEDIVIKVARSFYAAACMILGTDEKLYNKYMEWGTVTDDQGNIFVVMGESISPDGSEVFIPLDVCVEDDDRLYFETMKDVARKMALCIPSEEIKIPKDEWPEPKWQPPEEKKE
jgi:hypothetical protein